jgi:CRP/FNR family transcriptional regulator, cyclic AMP receptor protein
MSSQLEKNDSYRSCEFQDNLDILRQIYFFSGLPMEALKVFAYICSREDYKAGDDIFRQGDDDGQAIYIISGSARLVYEDGQQEITIRSYGAGDFLGGMALLGNVPRLFTLKAETNITCLVLSQDKFNTTIAQFPDLMPKIIKQVVERISSWEEGRLATEAQNTVTCSERVGVSLV